mgnify:FL=1
MSKIKPAFTLAEVLITLGVIGIVAAMTLPTLIANYQKELITTRLKHFSSLLQQAATQRNKDIIEGDFIEMKADEVAAYNPDDMEKFYKQYWFPYIKTINMTKLNKGLLVEYSNGTGAYFQRVAVCEPTVDCSSHIVFCPEYKWCKDIDKENAASNTDGKHTFAFWTEGTVPRRTGITREQLLNSCKSSNKYLCSSLIEYDGWEIKDDYPW